MLGRDFSRGFKLEFHAGSWSLSLEAGIYALRLGLSFAIGTQDSRVRFGAII